MHKKFSLQTAAKQQEVVKNEHPLLTAANQIKEQTLLGMCEKEALHAILEEFRGNPELVDGNFCSKLKKYPKEIKEIGGLHFS